ALEVGVEQRHNDRPAPLPREIVRAGIVPARQLLIVVLGIHQHRGRELLAVRQTTGLAGLLTRLGENREKDRSEDGDNRNHDEKFDQGKPCPPVRHVALLSWVIRRTPVPVAVRFHSARPGPFSPFSRRNLLVTVGGYARQFGQARAKSLTSPPSPPRS